MCFVVKSGFLIRNLCHFCLVYAGLLCFWLNLGSLVVSYAYLVMGLEFDFVGNNTGLGLCFDFTGN